MKTNEALREILERTGVTQATLAKRLNGTNRLISASAAIPTTTTASPPKQPNERFPFIAITPYQFY